MLTKLNFRPLDLIFAYFDLNGISLNKKNADAPFGVEIDDASVRTAGLGGRRKEVGGYKGGAA
jgi:hypothetical protein